MRNVLALALVSAALLAACGGGNERRPARAAGGAGASVVTAPAPARHVPCDDGGSGGVMIEGVCL